MATAKPWFEPWESLKSEADGAEIDVSIRSGDEPLADVIIKTEKTRNVPWKAVFQEVAVSGQP